MVTEVKLYLWILASDPHASLPYAKLSTGLCVTHLRHTPREYCGLDHQTRLDQKLQTVKTESLELNLLYIYIYIYIYGLPILKYWAHSNAFCTYGGVSCESLPRIHRLMEPTTVGSLWLENDLHENELEFESHMGRSKKNVRVTSDGIHAEIHEIWTCVAPAAPPLCHAAVNPCLQSVFSWRESPWNWSCNSANLRKSTVTWMSRHYVFTVIFRWSTFSSTVNLCNINCVIFSDTHCSFGPPTLWHSPFHAGCRTSKIMKMECQNLP